MLESDRSNARHSRIHNFMCVADRVTTVESEMRLHRQGTLSTVITENTMTLID